MNCERVAKEYIGDDGRRLPCAASPPKGRSSVRRARRAPECRRVGVGRPKMVPRVTPTVICNLG